MAGVIPKEKLAGYQRWNIGSLDAKPAPHSQPSADMTSVAVAAPSVPVSHAEPNDLKGLPTAEDVARISSDAHAEGYGVGYREGVEAGRQAMAVTLAETTAHFAELIGNLQASLAQVDQHLADQVLAVSLEVAAQVIRSAIVNRPEMLLPVIREALGALPLHHAHVILRLNPGDAVVIREQIGEQLSKTGAQIIDDPDISLGGCLLVAGASEVDATIETRWKRVLESIGIAPSEWMSQL